MERNLLRRVEVCTPLLDERVKRRAVDEALKPLLADTADAWLLRPDGTYVRAAPEAGAPPFSAQADLLRRLSRQAGAAGSLT